MPDRLTTIPEDFHRKFDVDYDSSTDALLMALFKVMKKKPFADISVTEVCHAAGLSRKTFYKYFPDKEALLDYLTEDLVLGYYNFKLSDTDTDCDLRFRSFLHYFSFWYSMKEWVGLLVRDGL